MSLFEHRPIGDATTYCTLGLSRHLLQDANGRDYRLELVGSSYARFDDLTPYANLFAVSEDVLAEHRALLRGQVLGPRGPIVRGSTLEAFYCAQPVYFPDELAVFRESEPATILVWLVPITHAEAHFVWLHGWSAFEDLLVERDPDLLDLNRVSLV